jgi:hypothetical protein|nr:MAG TPA: hypothetical protein [Caudoviricetes sp.]
MAGITLNKGLQPFDIYFEDIDEHDTIYFNPSDSDLPKRLMQCKDIIAEKQKGIKPYEVDENGIPNTESAIAYMEENSKVICDTLDYAFGNKVSDVIFKHCGAFSIVNGEYYIMLFLNAITPELEKLIKTNTKTAESKANKYLKKYQQYNR